jgi:hypothetical protein
VVFLIPSVIWTIQTARRIQSLRSRALYALETRVATMSIEERERRIREIVDVYGGRFDPPTERRIEQLRSPRPDHLGGCR